MRNRLFQLLLENRGRHATLPVAQTNDSGDSAQTIYLYKPIVSSALEADFFDCVSAEQLVPEILDAKAQTLHLRINSPGGDVFAAQAIAQAIREFPGDVIAHIDGLCASAATVVSSASSKTIMAAGAEYMIHRAWTLAVGNMNDMLEMAAWLEKTDETLANQYAAKTGMKPADLLNMMDKTTVMTSGEAKSLGFIDEVGDVIKAGAEKWNLSAYSGGDQNTPMKNLQASKDDELIGIEKRQFLARKTRVLTVLTR